MPTLAKHRATREEDRLVIFRKRVAGLSASTLDRFVRHARKAVRLPGIVNVLVTSSAELRALNRQFRGKDKPTDVLSFPSSSEKSNRGKRIAGELAISGDIAKENASELGHSLAEEIKILTLHGILHLAGFDHEQDHGEMAREETRLRRELKLKVGLIERSEGSILYRANPEPRRTRPVSMMQKTRRRTA
jgi:probable rRNA maturation factor